MIGTKYGRQLLQSNYWLLAADIRMLTNFLVTQRIRSLRRYHKFLIDCNLRVISSRCIERGRLMPRRPSKQVSPAMVILNLAVPFPFQCSFLRTMTSKFPSSFAAKKARILSSLSVPEIEYEDLSPKGSVDAKIRDLIDEINSQEGWVTTSSCAGRISVYLDGEKTISRTAKTNVVGSGHEIGQDENDDERSESVKAGGKGGGRWLFVSHDPVNGFGKNVGSYCDLFGLQEHDASKHVQMGSDSRLIHFKFEPMVSQSPHQSSDQGV